MPKILLVEDNEMNRDMLSRRLVRSGFEVVAGKESAPPAVDAAGHAHPRQWAAFTLSGPGTLRK